MSSRSLAVCDDTAMIMYVQRLIIGRQAHLVNVVTCAGERVMLHTGTLGLRCEIIGGESPAHTARRTSINKHVYCIRIEH